MVVLRSREQHRHQKSILRFSRSEAEPHNAVRRLARERDAPSRGGRWEVGGARCLRGGQGDRSPAACTEPHVVPDWDGDAYTFLRKGLFHGWPAFLFPARVTAQCCDLACLCAAWGGAWSVSWETALGFAFATPEGKDAS